MADDSPISPINGPLAHHNILVILLFTTFPNLRDLHGPSQHVSSNLPFQLPPYWFLYTVPVLQSERSISYATFAED